MGPFTFHVVLIILPVALFIVLLFLVITSVRGFPFLFHYEMLLV